MIPDDVWMTIKEYLLHYRDIEATEELRQYLEKNAEVKLFDGGAFIAVGTEFDLFVVPEKRGKWGVKKEIEGYLSRMHEKYPKIAVKIYSDNIKSLRLARFFGFKECGTKGRMICMEREYHG